MRKSIFKTIITGILLLMIQMLGAQRIERSLNSEKWIFAEAGTDRFLPATVPGTVHTDLFNNKIIPDPFYGDNEKNIQWIEDKDWIYQTSFKLSPDELSHENINLIFNGLDTYAKVWLNGNEILNADNMFRTWKSDVKKLLRPGKNELKIYFTSASATGKKLASTLPYTLPEKERVFVRKAQYQFGWDWGPRFVTAGIWKPVVLEMWNQVKIENTKFSQKLTKDRAEISFLTELTATQAGTFTLNINKKKQKVELKDGKNTIKTHYTIKNPKLWYPNGFGTPELYPISISLEKGKTKLDGKNLNIGLRTIELVQEQDKEGKSFYFKVNGIPVYAKGANVIPPHEFVPSTDKNLYKKWMSEAKFANMNMLRIWGGGIYADDEFYDEADKNGILIWQDFMFACAMYPGDEHFINNVKKEVADQANRLQNHASLAIWCGNNENDEGWHNWGWQKQLGYSKTDSAKIWNDYVKTFRKAIPETLDSVSAQKPIYWQSSPSNGWGRDIAYKEGDVHYWGVWWGMEPFEKYREKTGRFVSEYGFQGMPSISTIKTFTENLSFNDSGIKNHQKHATGYETIRTYMERDYKVPEKFEDFTYISQLLQARGLKAAVEAHRQQKPYNMGTLYWQFNDVWPVTSWSSLDYYGTRKAAHYEARRLFRPVYFSVDDNAKDTYRILLNNDTHEKSEGNATIELVDIKGKILFQKSLAYTAEPMGNRSVLEIPKGEFLKFNSKATVLRIRFGDRSKDAEYLYFFAKPKDLVLKKANLNIRRISDDKIEISTDVLAKDIYLEDGMNNFSNNFFTLLPNEKTIITSENPLKDLKIKMLNDLQ